MDRATFSHVGGTNYYPVMFDDSACPGWVLNRSRRGSCCWLWTGSVARKWDGDGRLVLRAVRTGGNVARLLVAEIAGRELGHRELVAHSCDVPLCVRPSHLRLATPAENAADAVARRRIRPGGRISTSGVVVTCPPSCRRFVTETTRELDRRGRKPPVARK